MDRNVVWLPRSLRIGLGLTLEVVKRPSCEGLFTELSKRGEVVVVRLR